MKYDINNAGGITYQLPNISPEKTAFYKLDKEILLYNRDRYLFTDNNLEQLLNNLNKENKSDLTIKNYINDINQYLDWLKNYEIRN